MTYLSLYGNKGGIGLVWLLAAGVVGFGAANLFPGNSGPAWGTGDVCSLLRGLSILSAEVGICMLLPLLWPFEAISDEAQWCHVGI